MAQLLTFALARIGHTEVTVAAHGVEAIRKLAESRYELLLVDINMPIMDGLKLVRHIRSSARHRDVPIIVITVERGRADRERAMKLGADAYLVKPIQAGQLIAKARELLWPKRAEVRERR